MTSVYTFGQDSYGELGHGDTQERYEPKLVEDLEGLEVVQVVAGNEHTAVLCANGDVLSCGYNESGQCGHGHNQRVQNLTLITALKVCAFRPFVSRLYGFPFLSWLVLSLPLCIYVAPHRNSPHSLCVHCN
jgi:hypothetical protein